MVAHGAVRQPPEDDLLLTSLGFDARRVAGAMFNMPAINHGSVKVRLDEVDWLADSSMLSDVPLPLTEEVFVSDAAVAVEVEAVGDSHFIWTDFRRCRSSFPAACGWTRSTAPSIRSVTNRLAR